MKIKYLLSCFILMFATAIQLQAQTVPTDGAIYRISNAAKSDAVIAEDVNSHGIYCEAQGDDKSYNQLWKFTKSTSGWKMQNIFTGRYSQTETERSVQFVTEPSPSTLYISENSTIPGCYNILSSSTGTWGMHCNNDYDVTPWYRSNNGVVSGAEWLFEKVSVSEEEITEARRHYEEFSSVMNNKDDITSLYPTFFEDDMCTVLKSEYASMSDDELSAAMSTFGQTLINAALKIKNDSWAVREKEFRIHTYEPYSNPDTWAPIINTKKYSWLSNPTGIYADACDILYVFVGAEPADSSTLHIGTITGTTNITERIELKKGMNLVPVARNAQSLFVLYTADTSGDKLIADFDSIPIHIEGGVLNGYWDKSRHTDADWIDITRNLATHKFFTVKGDSYLYFMELEYLAAENCCYNTISDAIGWWDDMASWQRGLMGIEEYRPSRFNNMQCAISTESGYQSATDYRTNYVRTALKNLLPYKNMMGDGDRAWGPAHENGHVHNLSINMIGGSEVSNNMFSNLTIYKLGKNMSRGGKISELAKDFEEKVPWPMHNGELAMRMYWQLYLYYHAAGNNPDFYPTLFRLLREERLQKKSGGYLNFGSKDLLLFAEKCCEASGENMTDFFEAWGFFVPMNRLSLQSYGEYVISSTEEMIADTKTKMASYPKRAGAIQFIEDRILPELRTDGVDGYKVKNGVGVGEAGDVGHYTSFCKDSSDIVPEGYIYSKAGHFVTISKGCGAVGFKIYDSADSTLLTFSNTFIMELSEEFAAKDVIVAAVSANGTEVIINSKNNGSEEEQLEALNEALVSAQEMLKFKDGSSKKVGYYYESVLLNLISLAESAQSAMDNKDQSVNSYGEWATLIDKEIKSILSKENTKVTIHPENTYQLKNMQYSNYTMYFESGNILCKSGTSNPKARMFSFTPTGKEGEYYLSTNGKYIGYVEKSKQTTASATDAGKAVKFTISEPEKAVYYIHPNGDTGNSLNCNSSKIVIGWSANTIGSQWQIVAVSLVKEKADVSSLNTLINEAERIYDTIVDTTDTESGTLFKDGVEVINETLAADVDSMMSLVDESETVISKRYYECCPGLIELLTDAIAKVKAGYSVVTGINGILFDDEDSVIYDIRGRRIDKITSPGYYIINGKKVYVK